jgi:hypothetical protein
VLPSSSWLFSLLSQLIIDNLHTVGQPIQAADPLSSGSSRLKAGCGQDCPAHNGCKNLKGQDISSNRENQAVKVISMAAHPR